MGGTVAGAVQNDLDGALAAIQMVTIVQLHKLR